MLYCIYIAFIKCLSQIKLKLYVPQESTGLTGWLGYFLVGYTECKFVLCTNSPRKGGMLGTVYPNSLTQVQPLI